MLVAAIVLAVLATAGWFAARFAAEYFQLTIPGADQCQALGDGGDASITPSQAALASVIVAEAQRRQLPPRAASIALATAFQESGIRNLDHGDLDSVGLFQQRPSQGWGTAKQIMDPWYASGKFYEALVKVADWQTRDPNDIAQKVQISAHPEAYRKHVPRAKALASALAGETPAAFGCRVSKTNGDPDAALALLTRTFGNRVVLGTEGATVRVQGTEREVWSAVSLSIANASSTGLRGVQIGEASWTSDSLVWKGRATSATSAELRFG